MTPVVKHCFGRISAQRINLLGEKVNTIFFPGIYTNEICGVAMFVTRSSENKIRSSVNF